MKRVNFQIHDFPNFVKYAHDSGNDAWEQDFIDAGFSSIKWGYDGVGGFCSLSEEEYTWFILRWS